MAGLATCILFLGFTLISKYVKSELQSLGLVLYSCLNAFVIFDILNLIFGFGEMFNYVCLRSGFVIFSLFVAYDTEDMKQRFLTGNVNYVSPTVYLFLNIINIFVTFVRLLTLLKKPKAASK